MGYTLNIGIIGAGNIGGALARHFVSMGHRVAISNSRGPGSLATFAAERNVLPVSVKDVVRDKHLVVIAIPEDGVLALPQDLFAGAAGGTIVVDAGNYYPGVRDVQITEIDGGMPESEWVAQRLDIPILKAFNSITVWSLATRGLPSGTPGRIALPVAGDDSRDKEVLLSLLHQMGFDGFDAGTLAESWRQQPGTPAYCMDLDIAGLIAALGKAEYSRIDQYRANALAGAKQAVDAMGSLAAAMAAAGKPAE